MTIKVSSLGMNVFVSTTKKDQHAGLMSDLSKMDIKKRKKSIKAVRLLPDISQNVSLKSTVDYIGEHDIKQMSKNLEPLEKPLEKPVAKRVARASGFEKVAVEASRYEGIVNRRRKADMLSFPLQRNDCRVITTEKSNTSSVPQLKSSLEKEVYSLLYGDDYFREAEKKSGQMEDVEKAMSMREIEQKSKEIWKEKLMRIRLEQKIALQNKSKSKTNRRVNRKSKLSYRAANSKPISEEEMKIEEDKQRVIERMSLRHRNSKWVTRQKQINSKLKMKSSELDQANILSQNLVAKSALSDDEGGSEGDGNASDEDIKFEDIEADDLMKHFQKNNPWLEEKKSSKRSKSKGEECVPKIVSSDIEQVANDGDKSSENNRKKSKKEDRLSNKDDVEDSNSAKSKKLKKPMSVDATQPLKEKKFNKSKNNDGAPKKNLKKERLDCNVEKKKVLVEKTISDGKNVEKKAKSVDCNNEDLNNTKNVSKLDPDFDIDTLFDAAEIALSCGKETTKEKKINKKNEKKKKNIKKKKVKKGSKSNKEEGEECIDFSVVKDEELLDERRERIAGISLDQLSEDDYNWETNEDEKPLQIDANVKANYNEDSGIKVVEFDASKFPQIQPRSMHSNSHLNFNRQFDDDSDEDAQEIIRDAFKDDYIMEDFKSEKEKEEAVPLKEENVLKGWGSWTGPGIVERKRKRRTFKGRLTHNPPTIEPPKKNVMGNVIYNQNNDIHKNLQRLMVKSVPYPFESIEEYEASISAPTGRLFVPEIAHQNLIKPSVKVKVGSVIEPMGDDQLLKGGRKNREEKKKWQESLKNKLEVKMSTKNKRVKL